ncbi:MAG: SPASM domain-containing protein [Candidatus Aminicenantes bacterium]|nr:SPASM domain-containing protein [Candidatus Aminicenantes bacterium]NIM80651.1 SPASM domain-containing protein [Candidatus Aminicenantes bacterium]NIN20032.1 SPASM domain-containing protein [Candidatus Aminicenantes bacterium]NIN43820.1 SPASM domain-containing protein [Candidatus Aminicenantes bacterium]NIN86630.1 SPASM domain-containing protein [Candidatus Aminicenantes bacterium]
MRNQTLTAIMEVTTRCNYSCTYCYVGAEVSGEEMTLETLRATIQKLLSIVDHSTIRFIWHGGEPLLRGLEFFEHVIALQEELNVHDKTCINAIQTNGSLLNGEIVDFFKRNAFQVGLSLDGPREFNDATRKCAQDCGTYETTLEKIRLLKENGCNTGAIATITKQNNHYPAELYRLFKDIGIHMKLGQLRNSGRAKSRGEELRLLPKEYGEFATQLFDIWLKDRETTIEISPFESIMRSMFKPDERPVVCFHAGRCHNNFVGISPNGDVYPCGLYQGYEDFRYGNIHDLRLDEIEKTRAYETLELRQEVVNHLCGECIFFEYCHGGCPFSALCNNGDILSKDYYCEAFKMIFQHVAESSAAIETSQDLKNKLKIICGGGGGKGTYTVHSDGPYTVYIDYTDYQVVV